MRRTEAEAQQTKADLLDAALAEFSQKGYAAARLQDIARRAGTTRGAIYHHFENKAGLYTALIKSADRQGSAVIQAAVAGGGSFADICRRILTGTLALLENDTKFRQTVALNLFRSGVSDELAAVEEEQAREAGELVAGIAAYMQMGVAAGEVRADIAPQVLARAFLAYQNGLAWLWLAAGRRFALDEDAEAYAEVLLHGILNPPPV